MQRLLFSVIIPTCHHDDFLSRYLQRLAPDARTLPADSYEVIVSGDGTRGTAAMLMRNEYPWAHWTEDSHKGPAATGTTEQAGARRMARLHRNSK